MKALLQVDSDNEQYRPPFLLSEADCQAAVNRKVPLADDWGWVATCFIGGGTRGRSVINICKVSGEGPGRVIEYHKIIELPADILPLAFAEHVFVSCNPEQYPNISIGIEQMGFSYIAWEVLDNWLKPRDDVSLQPINWHDKPLKLRERSEYKDQRSLAYAYTAAAIKTGCVSLDADPRTVAQFSFLPYLLNDNEQLEMMATWNMERIYQIRPPFLSDAYCMVQLVEYTPVGKR